MSTLARELRTLTYTPALCAHLEDLRRSYTVAIDLCRHRIEECEGVQDSDGVKVAQVDQALASMALDRVMQHLALANKEWTR